MSTDNAMNDSSMKVLMPPLRSRHHSPMLSFHERPPRDLLQKKNSKQSIRRSAIDITARRINHISVVSNLFNPSKHYKHEDEDEDQPVNTKNLSDSKAIVRMVTYNLSDEEDEAMETSPEKIATSTYTVETLLSRMRENRAKMERTNGNWLQRLPL